MPYELTVSSQGQIIIPSAIRKHLGIKPGSKVVMRLEQQHKVNTATIEAPLSWITRVRGIAKNVYGKGEDYIKNERDTWEKQ